MMKIKYGAGNLECNCQVVLIYQKAFDENELYDVEIEFCPTHITMPALLEALKKIEHIGRSARLKTKAATMGNIARQAIAQVEGR